jgi:hypothetical protein
MEAVGGVLIALDLTARSGIGSRGVNDLRAVVAGTRAEVPLFLDAGARRRKKDVVGERRAAQAIVAGAFEEPGKHVLAAPGNSDDTAPDHRFTCRLVRCVDASRGDHGFAEARRGSVGNLRFGGAALA